MRLKEFLLSEKLDAKTFAAWKQAMKAKGAVDFEAVEMDNVLALGKDGNYLGSYDKQRNVAEAVLSDYSVKPTKVTYKGQDGVSRTFDAIPFDMWTPAEMKAAALEGGVGIKGLPRRKAEQMIASTGRHFLIKDFNDGTGRTFKQHFVTKSWVQDYAGIKEAAKPGDEDYDGDEQEVDMFFVAGWNEDESKSWVGKIENTGGKWVETTTMGAAPDNWGGKRYMSYLSPQDVMGRLSKDYDEVDGPFFAKEEAVDHAKHRYGPLGR